MTMLDPGTARSYGVLTHEQRDRLHMFAAGYAYASPWVVTRATTRPLGVVMIALDNRPFTVSVRGRNLRVHAAAQAPNVCRDLQAQRCGLVSLNVMPMSPFFPAFRGIPVPGLIPLERSAFRPLEDYLQALYFGAPCIPHAAARFSAVVETAIAQFPRLPSIDPRLPSMLASMVAFDAGADSRHEASELGLRSLAGELGLSYHRASHLFSQTLGIPLKSFLAWRKCMDVFVPMMNTQLSLTQAAHEAGLGDSAYLSRMYQRWFGQRPSYARDSNSVQVFYRDARYPRFTNNEP